MVEGRGLTLGLSEGVNQTKEIDFGRLVQNLIVHVGIVIAKECTRRRI
jgi:hypothetical protein